MEKPEIFTFKLLFLSCIVIFKTQLWEKIENKHSLRLVLLGGKHIKSHHLHNFRVRLFHNKNYISITVLAWKWPHGQKAERKTASNFIPTERPKGCWKEMEHFKKYLNKYFGVIRGFQSFGGLSVKEKFYAVFFGHSALSFSIGTEHSYYYKIDTPKMSFIICQNKFISNQLIPVIMSKVLFQ